MSILGQLTLFSLIPVIFALFLSLPPRKAVLYSFLWGWLFLPLKFYPLHGLTAYSKLSATSFGVLLAACCFDTNRVLALRPKLWDIPMLIYACSPFFASMHNGLGPYDGGSASVNQFFFWSAGYLIGRIYFTDLEGLRELAVAFIIGGLLYAPLCLFEVRMSPQLNEKIYGFSQLDMLQSKRLGGFRPLVFMQHGIAVGAWLMSTALVACWLWWCGTYKRLWTFTAGFWALFLLGTLALSHAGAALAQFVMGMGLLFCVKAFRLRVALAAALCVAPVYTYARAYGNWQGEDIVTLVAKVSPDRASSLEFRLHNEDLFVGRAKESPVYGWGGWNRFQVQDEQGRDIGVPDQQWIIAFGKMGLVGLCSFILALSCPILVLMRRVPVRYWGHPAVAPAAVLAVVVLLHLYDCLINAMVNPIFMMACGGVTGLLPVKVTFVSPRARRARRAPARLDAPFGVPVARA